jgi:hypothetical protein
MHRHAHAQQRLIAPDRGQQRALRIHCGHQRRRGRFERRVERVSDDQKHLPACALDGRAQQAVMLRQVGAHRIGIAFPALHAARDVGEEKRDVALR